MFICQRTGNNNKNVIHLIIIREKKGRVPCKKLSARKVTLLKLANITRSVFTSYLSVARVGIIEFCGTNCCRSAVCGFIRLVYIHLCQETIVFKNFQYFYISKFSHVLGKLFRERVTGKFSWAFTFFHWSVACYGKACSLSHSVISHHPL